MNTSTKYLGLTLKNPIIVGSSKMTGDYEKIMECIECGAGAVVLKSLFEEQIISEIEAKLVDNQMYFWYPEAMETVKSISKDHGKNEYIKLLTQVKANSPVPVIASINCLTSHEWPVFASEIQKAGADAIELNISVFPFDETITSSDIEDTYINIVNEVKKHVTIPVCVKIGSFFTNINSMVSRLDTAGVDGIVLFNRFFMPDININDSSIIYNNYLSDPSEMTQSLRWIGLLSPKVKCDLVASTGIHDFDAVVKQIMAGAAATQICSVLYKKGIPHIKTMLAGLEEWMKKNHYPTLDAFRGKILTGKAQNAAFERVQFMKRTTGF